MNFKLEPKISIFALIMIGALIACNQTTTENTAEATTQETTETQPNIDSLVNAINQKRAEIENNLAEPIIISTADLRPKISQKWEKIHVYMDDNVIVRVKTYPHSAVSKRTEEFYMDNGELIMAVIEDNGGGDKGKSLDSLDKVYYFNKGLMIKEIRKAEKEYTINNSDAEELLEEITEYIEIAKSK